MSDWLDDVVSWFLRRNEEKNDYDDPLDWVKGRRTEHKAKPTRAELAMTQLKPESEAKLRDRALTENNEYLNEFLNKK